MLALRHHNKKVHKNKISKTHKLLDQVIYVFALIGPIMTVPQIAKIWIERTNQGVSILTWGSYLLIDFIWFYYGIVHRDKAIIFAYTLWIIVNSMVVVGLLMR
jgi:uncharacterized protein with PQ loop repeat